jgi:hypothetical protein
VRLQEEKGRQEQKNSGQRWNDGGEMIGERSERYAESENDKVADRICCFVCVLITYSTRMIQRYASVKSETQSVA